MKENIEKIYQEFEEMHDYLSQAEYLGKGKKRGLFLSEEQQQWVWSAYLAFDRHIKSKNIVIETFYLKRLKKLKNTLLLLDESHDASSGIIKLLNDIFDDLVLVYDPHQRTEGFLSLMPYIKTLFGERLKEFYLSSAQRYPNCVADVANLFIDIKYEVTCGKSDKSEYTKIVVPEGKVKPGDIRLVGTDPTVLR